MDNAEYSNGAHPVQIMDFETPNDPSLPKRLKLYKDQLAEILDQAGDMRISIISIAGPSRKGKSFFLGFMIRYLEALEQDESDWMGWDNKNRPLTGFKWRSGIDHETSGMLMWSKPFIVKMNNEKVAVLLVDTQGTFDEFTTQREWSAIVGLSLLNSSCLIFNSFNDVQEDSLNTLETYIQYGLMALGNDSQIEDGNEAKIHPFQKLFFLIRDWSMPTEFPFGSAGGRAYLEKKLTINHLQPESAQRVRKTIKQCFDQLDCFLMPNPGEKSMLEGFNGSLSQLSTNFNKKMEELVSDLLNPDELPLKTIFGNEVIASDMLSNFEQYLEIFNGDDMPGPTTLMEATAKISNQNLLNKSKRQYIDNMKKKQRGKCFLSEKKLENAHKVAVTEAVNGFKKSRKIGSPEMITSFEEDLIFEIKIEFDKIFADNESKKLKQIELAKNESVKSFIDSLMDEFDNKESFLEDKRLKSSAQTIVETCISEFKEKLNEESEEQLEKLETVLISKLNEEQNRILTENRNRKLEAEKVMNDLVKKITKAYNETMSGYLEQDPFLAKDDLTEYHSEAKSESISKFDKVNKSWSKVFIKGFLKTLETSIDKEFEEVQLHQQLLVRETEVEAMALLNQTIQEYNDGISREIEDALDLDESQLELAHTALAAEAEINFLAKLPYPETAALRQEILSKFKQELQSKFESVQKDVGQAKKDCEESHTKGVEASLQFYRKEMEEFAKLAEFHEDKELNETHDKFETEAMEFYNNFPKVGVHSTPDKFPRELMWKIQAEFEKLENSNIEKRKLAEERAKNNISSRHQEYHSEMIKHADVALDDQEFEDFHKLESEKVSTQFLDSCSIKDESFTKPYLDELRKDIEEAYEELKEYFEMKKTEREGQTETALTEVRKYYREEMEKHYKNTDFMRPIDLDDLSTRVIDQAILKALQNTPLSESQKTNLISELQKIFEEEFKKVNDMNVPVDPAIGIDLGTTYSCVAVYWKGKVTIIPNAQGKNTMPSYVCYNDQSFVESVGDPAKSKAYEHAENTIYDAKRIIGRKFEDEKLQNNMKYWAFNVVEEGKVPKVNINGKTFYPEQISAEVLKEMRAVAEKYLNCEIKNAVITVPAYFDDGQRQATIDAGEIAGLKVLNIMNEPTAAAVAYKLQNTDDTFRHALIFDLGGGTFDVAVLKMTKGNIEVLSVDGDTHLGGEDFDQNTMKFCALEFQRQHGIDLMEGKDSENLKVRQDVRKRLKRLQLECERKKIELASCRKVDVALDGIYNDGTQSIDLNVTLTRDKFEELNDALFEMTIKIVEKALKSAGLDKTRIKDIILVGGSTRIPKVQELLVDFFDGKALNKTVNPDEAVAYGAAVDAAIRNGQLAQESEDFNKIQDVTPMSLGVEVYGGGFSVIIPKSTKLPAKIKEQYRTAHNNQTSVQITIYQGEDNVAKQNNWLGEFYLNGIPPADAGKETINVTMEIGHQGVLHVTAVCTSTGDTGSITVTENKRRMGRETIKRILGEANPSGP